MCPLDPPRTSPLPRLQSHGRLFSVPVSVHGPRGRGRRRDVGVGGGSGDAPPSDGVRLGLVFVVDTSSFRACQGRYLLQWCCIGHRHFQCGQWGDLTRHFHCFVFGDSHKVWNWTPSCPPRPRLGLGHTVPKPVLGTGVRRGGFYERGHDGVGTLGWALIMG